MQYSQNLPVVLTDDDEDFFFFVNEAYQELKIPNALEYFKDGDELLERLSDKTKPLPCLILLDLNMPKMSGQKTLKMIRSTPALQHLPTVILTISDSQEEILECYRLGANSFITKPGTPVRIKQMMTQLKLYWLECVQMPKWG